MSWGGTEKEGGSFFKPKKPLASVFGGGGKLSTPFSFAPPTTAPSHHIDPSGNAKAKGDPLVKELGKSLVKEGPEFNFTIFPKYSAMGWYLGPKEVPIVFGPMMPKADSLLLSLMFDGFGRDVHVLNAMARQINNTNSYDNLGMLYEPASKDEVREAEDRLRCVRSSLHTGVGRAGCGRVRTAEEHSELLDALYTARRLFRAGMAACEDVEVICEMALVGRSRRSPFLVDNGALPIEYLSAAFVGLLTYLDRCTRDKRLPKPRVDSKALVTIGFEELAQGGKVTGLETGGASITAARLFFLCAVYENEPKTANTPVEQAHMQLLCRMLEHPNDRITAPAIRLVGSFTSQDDEPLEQLIQCGFQASLPKLLNRTRSGMEKIHKDALWALYNTLGGSPEQRAPIIESRLDVVALRFLSSKHPAESRNEAVYLADLLCANKLLRVECVYQVATGISEIFQVEWDNSHYGFKHRINLLDLASVFCYSLDRTYQHSHPKLFADCVKLFSGPSFIEAMVRHLKDEWTVKRDTDDEIGGYCVEFLEDNVAGFTDLVKFYEESDDSSSGADADENDGSETSREG